MKSDRKKLKKLLNKVNLGYRMNLGETLLIITADDDNVNGEGCFCQFVFNNDGAFVRLEIGDS